LASSGTRAITIPVTARNPVDNHWAVAADIVNCCIKVGSITLMTDTLSRLTNMPVNTRASNGPFPDLVAVLMIGLLAHF